MTSHGIKSPGIFKFGKEEEKMTTIQPDSEDIRKAVKWIIEERQHGTTRPLEKLLEEASRIFDLSPLETEFLQRFVKNEKL